VQTCPKCQSDRVIRNGSAAGKPKKQCKQCGYQFTRTTPRGKPLATKINAILWYLSGMSMNRIAFLLRVSAQAVLTWIRDLATAYYESPNPRGEPSSWNSMRCGTISRKSGANSESGKHSIVTLASSWTGNVGDATRRH
jgi:transposase